MKKKIKCKVMDGEVCEMVNGKVKCKKKKLEVCKEDGRD